MVRLLVMIRIPKKDKLEWIIIRMIEVSFSLMKTMKDLLLY